MNTENGGEEQYIGYMENGRTDYPFFLFLYPDCTWFFSSIFFLNPEKQINSN